jgi:aspartate aminotransferase
MLSKRVLALKPSPTLALNAKAKELKSQGRDVISLSVGEPDWDTFEAIRKAGIEAIERGETKYSPANGILALREALAQKASHELGVGFTPSAVTVSAGAKFVIFAALQSLLDPGDEVIIPAPYWVSYPPMVELAGGLPVCVECSDETNFKLSPEALDKHITPSTKLLILCSPSNPTGQVYSRDELKDLTRVLEKHPHVFVLSDDIYNRLIFDGVEIAPHLLQVAPQLKDRVLSVNGGSKSYSMTGWRIGWALGPQKWIDAMTNYNSQSVSCAATFTQIAVLEAVKSCDEEVLRAVEKLKRRRDLVVAKTGEISGMQIHPPGGAFYAWLDIRQILGKTFQGSAIEDSKAFADLMLDKALVAVVPGIEFGLEGYVRASFALSEQKMVEAFDRMKVLLS